MFLEIFCRLGPDTIDISDLEIMLRMRLHLIDIDFIRA